MSGTRGVIDQALDYLADQIVCEMKTLATNVNVGAGANTSQYTIPSKTGYKVGAVTPVVTGSYWGHYLAIFGAQNSKPTYVYFKNTHTSAHTNSFYAYVMYVKE